MKLEAYLKKVKPLLKGQDFITIYAEEKLRNGNILQHSIYNDDLTKYPLLLKADIIASNEYESKYSLLSLRGQETASGICKQYSAKIDLDQYKIAIKYKGIKSLDEIEAEPQKATASDKAPKRHKSKRKTIRRKHRFTL